MWEDDGFELFNNIIDSFTFRLSNPLDKFDSSNSLTVQGHHKVGILTLNYGNITTDPTPGNSKESPLPSIPCQCSSMECPKSSTSTHYILTTAPCQCNSMECPIVSTSTHYILTTAPCQCNSMEYPIFGTSTLTNQGT